MGHSDTHRTMGIGTSQQRFPYTHSLLTGHSDTHSTMGIGTSRQRFPYTHSLSRRPACGATCTSVHNHIRRYNASWKSVWNERVLILYYSMLLDLYALILIIKLKIATEFFRGKLASSNVVTPHSQCQLVYSLIITVQNWNIAFSYENRNTQILHSPSLSNPALRGVTIYSPCKPPGEWLVKILSDWRWQGFSLQSCLPSKGSLFPSYCRRSRSW